MYLNKPCGNDKVKTSKREEIWEIVISFNKIYTIGKSFIY
jgi:hypothetical protein